MPPLRRRASVVLRGPAETRQAAEARPPPVMTSRDCAVRGGHRTARARPTTSRGSRDRAPTTNTPGLCSVPPHPAPADSWRRRARWRSGANRARARTQHRFVGASRSRCGVGARACRNGCGPQTWSGGVHRARCRGESPPALSEWGCDESVAWTRPRMRPSRDQHRASEPPEPVSGRPGRRRSG